MVNDLGDKVVPNFNENRVIEQKYHLDLWSFLKELYLNKNKIKKLKTIKDIEYQEEVFIFFKHQKTQAQIY